MDDSENLSPSSELPVPAPTKDTTVDFALQLMRSNWLDSSITFVDQYLEKLPSSTETATDPVCLRLRVVRAEAMERDEQNDLVIKEAIRLAEDAEAVKDWIVLAQVQLVFARVYEKLGMVYETKTVLDKARTLINRHGLASVKPHYHVRRSSYFRIMSSFQDSALYHARVALRVSDLSEQTFHRAEANLLLGMLTVGQEMEVGVDYLEKSAEDYAAAGDIGSSIAMLENLAQIHLSAGQPEVALAYSDSIANWVNSVEDQGYEMKWFLAPGLFSRSESLAALGRYKEAYSVQAEAYQQQFNYLENQNRAAVASIRSEYKDEQQKRLILEQDALLAAGSRTNQIQQVAIGAGVLLSTIIVLLYFRGRWKNKQLSEAYQQEVALRGEVHHRVKNNLQIIIGLVEMQSDELKDPVALGQFDKLKERIYSMSLLHELIYQHDKVGQMPLRIYADRLFTHLTGLASVPSSIKYSIQMPEAVFSLQSLVPLGVILHELGTNSLKQVAPVGGLEIIIRLEQLADKWKLTYQDNGPGFPEGKIQARPGSLGTFLLTRMTRQLGGKLTTYNEGGATTSLTFPLQHLSN
ncbi:MAG: sensor histidine kinase [Lewinella sp.]